MLLAVSEVCVGRLLALCSYRRHHARADVTRAAGFFAFFLRVESVLVASAAAVPEPGTALGLQVVVPLEHKVPAGPLLLLQQADVHDWR